MQQHHGVCCSAGDSVPVEARPLVASDFLGQSGTAGGPKGGDRAAVASQLEVAALESAFNAALKTSAEAGPASASALLASAPRHAESKHGTHFLSCARASTVACLEHMMRRLHAAEHAACSHLPRNRQRHAALDWHRALCNNKVGWHRHSLDPPSQLKMLLLGCMSHVQTPPGAAWLLQASPSSAELAPEPVWLDA